MKKVLSLFVVAALLLTVGLVSADPICATHKTTFVSGIVTDQGNNLISGAQVTVECNGNIEKDISGENGEYKVQFTETECPFQSELSVSASYQGLSGESNSITWHGENTQIGCLELIVNVACANIPLVPEFGVIVGIVTALGALGVFFVVRRK